MEEQEVEQATDDVLQTRKRGSQRQYKDWLGREMFRKKTNGGTISAGRDKQGDDSLFSQDQ